MVRNGEGLVAGRLVVMADWCSMAFENGDGLMVDDVSMAVENDGAMAFDNGDGLVADEGSMAVENNGWLNVVEVGLSTTVEIGGW